MWFPALLGGAAVLLASACAPADEDQVDEPEAPTPKAKFVFATNNGDNTVSGYKIGSSGKLSEVDGSPFATGAGPKAVVGHPEGDFLYVGNSTDDTISGFEIDKSTGELTALGGSPYAVCDEPVALAMHPEGEFLYVACATGNVVQAYSIDSATGYLLNVQTSPNTFPGPVSLSVDDSGSVLAVANRGDGTLSILSIIGNGGGGLSEVIGSPFTTAASPQSVAVSPNGKYVYAPDDMANEVWGHKVDADTGALTVQSSSPYDSTSATPFGAKVAPGSTYLYVTSSGDSNVDGYKIGSEGKLTKTSTSSIATQLTPHGLDISAGSSQYVYVANYGADNVSAFKIGSSGNLTRLTGSPFAAGLQPWDVAVVNVLK